MYTQCIDNALLAGRSLLPCMMGVMILSVPVTVIGTLFFGLLLAKISGKGTHDFFGRKR